MTDHRDERHTTDGGDERGASSPAAAWSETAMGPVGDDVPHVFLLMHPRRDRRLLADLIGDGATVTATTDGDALTDDVDLCVVDRDHLRRHREALSARRTASDAPFFPVVLVTSRDRVDHDVWSVVDDVVSTPVSKAALRARLENLLARRRQSRLLADRETELESILAELRSRDRAIAEAPIGITLAGPNEADNPLLYVNDAFCELTGYDRSEVLGRNCRFLQGPGTDEETVETIRRAIRDEEPVSVDIVNYTADGERFWNKLDIAPVRDETGEVTQFVGFQTDITRRKIHEQRVNVMNRLLRHNLRNELNIIQGYADAVATGDEASSADAVDRIQHAVDRLAALSDEVRHVDRIFDEGAPFTDVCRLSELLEEVRGEITARHPDVTVDVEPLDEPVYVSTRALAVGCIDYVSMLLSRNDRGDRRVSLRARHTDSDGVVELVIGDNGPGITDQEWAVVESGYETPLHHADRLGLWVLRWVVTAVGGELIHAAESGGLHVRCPVRAPPEQDDDPDR